MRFPTLKITLALAVFSLAACKPPSKPEAKQPTAPAQEDLRASLMRINSTQQAWNTWQPWEKEDPHTRRALGAIVGEKQVLTTAELVADATYIELESPDGSKLAPAHVIAVDYEANLALIGPQEGEEGEAIFAGTKPFALADASKLGDNLQIIQVEDSGTVLSTQCVLQSVEVSEGFLPGQSFLTYRLKGSMQSASSSYSLPVLKDGKFAGVLLSYDSKDQISDVAASDLVTRFIEDAANGKFPGFPALGVATASTEDPSFRDFLKLTEDQGGIYVHELLPEGAAEKAGVLKDDVILAVDGTPIDRRGYYNHPVYGNLFWSHIIRGEKRVGDTVKLSIWRAGQPLDLEATLTRKDPDTDIVPTNLFDKAPNYLVKGGMVFQELTLPLLEAFGEKWTSRAPLPLLDAYENPEKYQGKVNRIVILSGVIPTPATVGYEPLRHLIVTSVNGQTVKDIASLVDAFDAHTGELQSIEFADENLTITLDDNLATQIDTQLMERGIPRLSRTDSK